MKDRIKNEVTAFLKSFPFGKVPDANQLAEHFYNLALEDVKKEVDGHLHPLEKSLKDKSCELTPFGSGSYNTLHHISDFIDTLKK